MHELSIAVRIVEIACKTAQQNGISSVSAVRANIGELTGIVPDALIFSFEMAAKNTACRNAVLEITLITPLAFCNACNNEFTPEGFMQVCHFCGSYECKILKGKELTVKSIIS